jgi:hypothetical protein
VPAGSAVALVATTGFAMIGTTTGATTAGAAGTGATTAGTTATGASAGAASAGTSWVGTTTGVTATAATGTATTGAATTAAPPSACAAPANTHDANAATQTLVLTFIAASLPKLLEDDRASETNPSARSGLTRSTLAIGEVLTIQSGLRGQRPRSGEAEFTSDSASNDGRRRAADARDAIFLGEDPTRPVSSPLA